MSVYDVLYILLVFSFAMSAAAMWINWLLNPHELAVRDWTVALSLTMVGCSMAIIARLNTDDPGDMVPLTFFSLLRDLGTSINGLAWFVLWRGILRFIGRNLPSMKMLFGAWLAFFAVLLIGHPLGMPQAWGVAWISLLVCILSLMVLYEILRYGGSGIATWFACAGFSGTALTWGVRAMMSFLDISRPIDRGFDTVVMFGAVITTFACMMALILLTNQRLIDRLGDMGSRDSLTGVLSRQAFFELTKPLLDNLEKNLQPGSIALLNIDNFSDINELYGSKSGDQALAQMALVIMRILGRQDLLARSNGGEFILFMHGKTAQQTRSLMNRLQVLMQQGVIDSGQGSFQISLSIGIADHRFNEDIYETISRAAKGLHRAKFLESSKVAIA